MQRHLVLISDVEFRDILSGESNYLIRFFKKKPDFIGEISRGDLVYFKKAKGEILGEFSVGKVVIVENLGGEDFKIVKEFTNDFKEEDFKKKTGENTTMVIVRIEKLEQFITSPIDVPARVRKEWTVLE